MSAVCYRFWFISPLLCLISIQHLPAQTLVLKDMLTESASNYLDKIIRASERMGVLIDSLLRLSRIGRQVLAVENINLTELVTNAINDYKDNSSEKIEFIIQEDMYCTGDRSLLQVAIDNLISNAVKYSTGCAQPVIEFGTLHAQAETVYFIKDNGMVLGLMNAMLTNYLCHFSVCTMIPSFRAWVSGWRRYVAYFIVMAAASGQSQKQMQVRFSILRSGQRGNPK